MVWIWFRYDLDMWGTPPTGSPRPLSPGRFGHGSRRAMERRNCGLPPAPCASQKQSRPRGSATSCHPSIHREVVRTIDPGSSSPFCSQSHDARPGNPHRPRWRRHPLEHPPPALPPHPPPQASRLPLRPWGGTPGIGLLPKSKWPGTWSAETVRATPDPPSDLHAAKRSARRKKKNDQRETRAGAAVCWRVAGAARARARARRRRNVAASLLNLPPISMANTMSRHLCAWTSMIWIWCTYFSIFCGYV